MPVFASLVSGLLAGLALAAPLGAIGVLLVQEGIARGWRRGLAAAAAVATVDVLYCIATVTAGVVAVTLITSWAPWPQIIGGLALVAIGVRGLVTSRRLSGSGELPLQASSTEPGARRYALFLGLTAFNPATLVYFAAILTGLGPIATSTATAAAFVGGVGMASFAWQALLVALGAGLLHTTGPTFRRWTSIIGNGAVIVLGLILVLQSF